MERQSRVHRTQRLLAPPERLLREGHPQPGRRRPIPEVAGAREGCERLLGAAQPAVDRAEPQRRRGAGIETHRPLVRRGRFLPALLAGAGGAEVGRVACIVGCEIDGAAERLNRGPAVAGLRFDRPEEVPGGVASGILRHRAPQRRPEARGPVGGGLDREQPLGDEDARRIRLEGSTERGERLVAFPLRLEDEAADGVVKTGLARRARGILARRRPCRVESAGGAGLEAHQPQDRLGVEVGVRRQQGPERRLGLRGAPEPEVRLRQHLVGLRERLPGVGEIQLGDRPLVVAPLEEVGREVAVIEDLRVLGRGRAARSALRWRFPLVPADVAERAEAREQLGLRLARRRVGGGRLSIARRPDRLVRGDAPRRVLRQERRVDRLGDHPPRHLARRRQSDELQERRRDVEEGGPDAQPGAAAGPGAAQEEDPLLVVPLNRLLGRVGERPLRPIGAGPEAVVGDDEHRRPGPRRVEDLAEQAVLVRVEAGDGVPVTGEVGVGADRHPRRHAVLEAVPHHVDPLEIDAGEVGVPGRQVGRDAGVVGAAGEDGEGQRRRVLDRLASRGDRVVRPFQDLAPRRRQGRVVDVQDRTDLPIGEVGHRPQE